MTYKPRKRFGQHFLHDKTIIRNIIDAINPGEGIPIVEIGPGQGALTLPLLEQTGSLDVIEIDRDLSGILAEKCGHHDGLRIHTENALHFDFCQLHRNRVKIVGNLPYNISTPLLFHLLDQIKCIQVMIFMMQKEIVDRICAAPNQRNYGRLSVMVQSRCHTEKIMNIGPGAFTPAPRVNSSLLRLIPRDGLQGEIRDTSLFSDVVRNAFSHRRKILRNALKEHLDNIDFERLGLVPTSRAETLTVLDYIRISNYLCEKNIHPNLVDKSVDNNNS